VYERVRIMQNRIGSLSILKSKERDEKPYDEHKEHVDKFRTSLNPTSKRMNCDLNQKEELRPGGSIQPI